MRNWLAGLMTALMVSSCTVEIPERIGGDMTASNGKKDGWSASGELRLGSSSKEVSMQADFDTPGTYTLQFDIKYPLSPSVGFFDWDMAAEADIFWSVEGNSIRRRVTITPGASISGTGQGVKVRLLDASQDNLGGISESANYPVSVQLAPGIRGGEAYPILQRAGDSVFTTVAGPVTKLGNTVPRDAGVKAIRVFATVETVGGLILPCPGLFALQLRVNETNGGPPFVYTSVIDPQDRDFIVLPKSASAYEVNVNAALIPAGAVNASVAVLWGIDG